jgi:hypothetical protein
MHLGTWRIFAIVASLLWLPIGFALGHGLALRDRDMAVAEYHYCLKKKANDDAACRPAYERDYNKAIASRWGLEFLFPPTILGMFWFRVLVRRIVRGKGPPIPDPWPQQRP